MKAARLHAYHDALKLDSIAERSPLRFAHGLRRRRVHRHDRVAEPGDAGDMAVGGQHVKVRRSARSGLIVAEGDVGGG